MTFLSHLITCQIFIVSSDLVDHGSVWKDFHDTVGCCLYELIIGITYIGQFSSAICKDAGYQMIGTQIDLFCKLSVMVLSMPVLLAILDTISEFMI